MNQNQHVLAAHCTLPKNTIKIKLNLKNINFPGGLEFAVYLSKGYLKGQSKTLTLTLRYISEPKTILIQTTQK